MVRLHTFVVLCFAGFATLLAGCNSGPAQIQIEPAQRRLSAVGDTLELKTLVTNAAGKELQNTKLTWSSSAPDVATVDNAIVTAIKSGSATISAGAGDVMASTEVQVSIPAVLTLSTEQVVVTPGNSVALTAQAADELGNPIEGLQLTFVIENSEVASVDANGLVTGVAPGETTLVVSAHGVNAQAKVLVTAGTQ